MAVCILTHMLPKCANPDCHSEMLYYRGGQVIAVHPRKNRGTPVEDSGAVEHFWLCIACSQFLLLRFLSSGKVAIVPRHHQSPSDALPVRSAA